MTQPPTPTSPERGGDPAMDDILASIRQILTEEDAGPRENKPPKDVLALDPSMMVPAPGSAQTPQPPDVLALEPSMMVPAPVPTHSPAPTHSPNDAPPPAPAPMVSAAPPPPQPPPAEPKPDIHAMPEPDTSPPASAPHSADGPAQTPSSLIAPKAAAAAASSLGELVRKLSSERTVAVHRGGPTIEDLVREELRPMLKEWLDTNLPALVERLVRLEIERVVGHTAL